MKILVRAQFVPLINCLTKKRENHETNSTKMENYEWENL